MNLIGSRILAWLILSAALIQFVIIALPPGNADLLSIQLLAFDLSHHNDSLLYPGENFMHNDQWVAHHEQNLRRLRVNGEPNWCFYPPLIPWLCTPFAQAGTETWRMLWGFMQIGFAIAFAFMIVTLLAAQSLPVNRILVFALVFGSYPVARSLALGQTSLLLALLLWFAVHLRENARSITGAVISGFTIFVKPFLFATELPRILRKRAFSALAAVTVAIAMLGVSLAIVGVDAHREYWNLLKTLSNSQTAFYGNQSLLAGIMRWTSNFPISEYGFQMDSTRNLLGKSVAVLVIAVCAYIQWRSRNTNLSLNIGMWMSGALLALPISWEHHLIFLLPVVAILWSAGAASKSLLAGITILLSFSWEFLYSDSAAGRMFSNFPMIGSLSLFALLVHHHLRSRRRIQSANLAA